MRQDERVNWTGRAAVLIAAAMVIFSIVFAPGDGAQGRRGIAFAEDTATSEMLDSPFKTVYERISPSVVGIQITTRTGAFGGRIAQTTDYVGSGVVISSDGYVLTNYHVVDGAEGIYVVSGEEAFPAEYIAGDQTTDVAVLRVTDERLPAPAVLGNSDALSVGDWALVIGNPLGQQFANTLTLGVISGLGRDLSASGSSEGATNMIQTNAAINAGNSGGGLFNIQGELVGVTSMKLSNNGFYGYASIEGIGLAIPINSVKTIVNDLLVYGKVRYPYVGVTMEDITSPTMTPTTSMLPRSVWVTEVAKNSPAAKAGIQVDDLIMEVDGVRVTSSSEVRSAVRKHVPGETVAITVYRIPGLSTIKVNESIPDGETLTFSVQVTLED